MQRNNCKKQSAKKQAVHYAQSSARLRNACQQSPVCLASGQAQPIFRLQRPVCLATGQAQPKIRLPDGQAQPQHASAAAAAIGQETALHTLAAACQRHRSIGPRSRRPQTTPPASSCTPRRRRRSFPAAAAPRIRRIDELEGRQRSPHQPTAPCPRQRRGPLRTPEIGKTSPAATCPRNRRLDAQERCQRNPHRHTLRRQPRPRPHTAPPAPPCLRPRRYRRSSGLRKK